MNNRKICHCKICNKDFCDNFFKKHLICIHNFSELDAFIEQEINTKSLFGDIPEDVVRCYLSQQNQTERYKINKCQFLTFYNSIIRYRDFDKEIDIRYFYDVFLPWKLKHPKINNCKEQCDIIFHDNKEFANSLYEETMLSSNPFKNHGGKYSPFSRKFVGYVNKTEDEIKEAMYKAGKYDKIGRNQNQKEYWMKRGYSEEDAKLEVVKHTNVFSLEKCIAKYGEEEGRKRFNERQIKWQNTLRSKSPDEIRRINHDKVYKNGPKSGVEYEFLNAVLSDEKYHNVFIKEQKVIVDLIVGNKIIEFYGDYWHCNPIEKRFSDGTYFHPYLKMTAYEKWEFDKCRIKRLKDANYGVKIVWEYDYKHNKEKIISECKQFLGVN